MPDTENKWLEYFAKLGVYSKVNVLCEPQAEILDMSTLSDSFIGEEDASGIVKWKKVFNFSLKQE